MYIMFGIDWQQLIGKPSQIRNYDMSFVMDFLKHWLQIAGPVSFRADTGVAIDLNKAGWDLLRVEEPTFALEYALHVLGSAKAIAWYSPKHREFMVELRFYET